MDKKEIPTVAQQPCVKYASEFTEKEIQDVNYLHTSSSTSTQIWYCAKLDWHYDAVAEAKSKYDPYLVNAISLIRWLNAFVNRFY